MNLKRAMVVLGVVLPLLVGRTGVLAQESSGLFGSADDWAAVPASFTTIFLACNIIPIAGSLATISQEKYEDNWAIFGIILGALGIAPSGVTVGVYSDRPSLVALGVGGLITGVTSIGTGIAYFVWRDHWYLSTRVMPTTLTDREGNMVPGVALQVVGF